MYLNCCNRWKILRCKRIRKSFKQKQSVTTMKQEPLIASLPSFGSSMNASFNVNDLIQKRNQSLLEIKMNSMTLNAIENQKENTIPSILWKDLPCMKSFRLEFEEVYMSTTEKTKGTKENVSLDPEWKGEAYEKMKIQGLSKTFKTFLKQVDKDPQQVIRYEWMGKPLLYNDQPILSPPPCPYCHSKRVFEFQMMPNLMNYIPRESIKVISNVDEFNQSKYWGTILVYSCMKDCHKEGSELFYAQEHVAIQLEI